MNIDPLDGFGGRPDEPQTTAKEDNDMLKFTTRAGLVYVIKVKEDIGHALVGEVIEAKRKHFIGKVLAFAKNDMIEPIDWMLAG